MTELFHFIPQSYEQAAVIGDLLAYALVACLFIRW